MIKFRLLLLVGVFMCAASSFAQADTVNAWVGLTLNATLGQHVESSGAVTLPALPVPIVDARVQVQQFELRAEALPPIGPVSWKSSNLNLHTTRLGYGEATLYYHLPGGLAVGAGGTLLTQYSTFSPAPYGDPLTQSARVAGVRWSAMETLPVDKDTSLTAVLSASPSMHANITSTYAPGTFAPTTQGETAALIDGSVAAERQFGSTALEIGVRYVNYSARFDVDGSLSDRNRLLMPFAGIHWRLR